MRNGEALEPSFKIYAHSVVENASMLAKALVYHGFAVTTGGTDNHLMLIDLTNKGIAGKPAAQALDRAGIVANYNAVPFDPRKPFDPSGLRIGTPSLTSRGMGVKEMEQLAGWIERVVAKPTDEAEIAKVAAEVKAVCARFPAPGLRT